MFCVDIKPLTSNRAGRNINIKEVLPTMSVIMSQKAFIPSLFLKQDLHLEFLIFFILISSENNLTPVYVFPTSIHLKHSPTHIKKRDNKEKKTKFE